MTYTNKELNKMCAKAEGGVWNGESNGNPADSTDAAIQWLERMGLDWNKETGNMCDRVTVFVKADICQDSYTHEYTDGNHAKALVLAGLRAKGVVE